MHNAHYFQTITRWQLYKIQLSPVFDWLQSQSIGFLVLKGWAFVGDLYPDLSQRPISDIDMLLHPQDLERVSDYLLSLGYHPVSGNKRFPNLATHRHDEVPLELTFTNSSGVYIDLHTHIMPSPWMKSAYEIEMGEVWAGSQPFTDWVGHSLQRLGWEHTILHLCTHLMRHDLGIHSPQSYLDLDRLVRKYAAGIDWKSTLEIASRWELWTGLCISLQYCQMLLNTPFPDQWMQELKCSRVRRYLIMKLIPWTAIRDKQPVSWFRSIIVKLLLIDRPVKIVSQIFQSIFPSAAFRKQITGSHLSLFAYWVKIVRVAISK